MQNRRFENLDLIKVFASVFIVFHHYQQVSGAFFDGINFYGGRILWGYLVELFFIISGFLSAMTIKNEDAFCLTIAKRVCRILPMAFLAVLFTYMISILYHYLTGNFLFGESYNFMQVITSLMLLNQGWIVEFFPAINNPIWYLCVLIWVTMLYSIIKHAVKGHVRAEIIISLVFVVIGLVGWELRKQYGIDFPFLHGSDFRGYATFFIGVCIYYLSSKLSERKLLLISIGLLVLSPIVVVVLGFSNRYMMDVFFFSGVVLFAISVPQIEIANISFWGGVSYEVYLWHMPMYGLLKLIVDISGICIEHSYFTMVVFGLFILSISYILYKYIEIPTNRKIQNLLRNVRNKKACNNRTIQL